MLYAVCVEIVMDRESNYTQSNYINLLLTILVTVVTHTLTHLQ